MQHMRTVHYTQGQQRAASCRRRARTRGETAKLTSTSSEMLERSCISATLPSLRRQPCIPAFNRRYRGDKEQRLHLRSVRSGRAVKAEMSKRRIICNKDISRPLSDPCHPFARWSAELVGYQRSTMPCFCQRRQHLKITSTTSAASDALFSVQTQLPRLTRDYRRITSL